MGEMWHSVGYCGIKRFHFVFKQAKAVSVRRSAVSLNICANPAPVEYTTLTPMSWVAMRGKEWVGMEWRYHGYIDFR
jgi:hypothetical protein